MPADPPTGAPMATNILTLPNEVLLEVVRRIALRSPLIDLACARQVCRLFASLSLPIMYRQLRLHSPQGTASVERHIVFLKECAIAAMEIRELTIVGVVDGLLGRAARGCILDADHAARLGSVLPRAERLVFQNVYWHTEAIVGPYPAFSSLTSLELRGTTMLRPGPFPSNVLRHLPFVTHTHLDFAPCVLIDNDMNEDIAKSHLGLKSMAFGPLIPFPADTIVAAIVASADDLEELSIVLTPVVHPPLFLDCPPALRIDGAKRLRTFCFTLPLFVFPPCKAANWTWTYANDTLKSIPRDIREISLTFECSAPADVDPYARLAAFPAVHIQQLLDRLSPLSAVSLTLQTSPTSSEPSWRKVAALTPVWADVLSRDNVDTIIKVAKAGASPFLMPYPLDDVEEASEGYLWWDTA